MAEQANEENAPKFHRNHFAEDEDVEEDNDQLVSSPYHDYPKGLSK